MERTSIDISYQAGMICEEVSFIEPGEQSYTVGSGTTVSDARLNKDREIIITEVAIESDGEGGETTQVRGHTKEYLYTRKSPTVPLTFMTLTSDEYSEFMAETNMSKLEYKPYIRIGKEFGIKGWTMHDIVGYFANWMGVTVEINLPDYDIKSFNIEPSETFFDALGGLVGAFEPIITLTGTILYILDKNSIGQWDVGTMDVGGMPRRIIAREYNPEPGCLKIEGQAGEYVVGRDPMRKTSNIKEKTTSYSGERILEDGSYEEYTVKEIWYLDQYEKEWALKSNTTITITTPPETEDEEGEKGIIETSYSKIVTEITYFDGKLIGWWGVQDYFRDPDTLCVEYESPVEHSTKVSTYTKWVDYDEEGEPILDAFGLWVLLNEKTISYDYDDKWILRGQTSAEKSLWIDIGAAEGWKLFDISKHWIANSEENEGAYNWDGSLVDDQSAILPSSVEKQELKQINKNSYSSIWTRSKYEWSADKQEWVTATETTYEIIQAGGVQSNKPTKRTQNVWAGTCKVYAAALVDGDSLVMEEPAKIVSLPTPDWDSIEEAYEYLADMVLANFKDVNIEAQELDPIPYIQLADTGVSGLLGGLYLTGYTIRLDEKGYTASLNCEGRVA